MTTCIESQRSRLAAIILGEASDADKISKIHTALLEFQLRDPSYPLHDKLIDELLDDSSKLLTAAWAPLNAIGEIIAPHRKLLASVGEVIKSEELSDEQKIREISIILI